MLHKQVTPITAQMVEVSVSFKQSEMISKIIPITANSGQIFLER